MRKFEIGEILTLESGNVWKVACLYDNDGRPSVGLTNPTNPNHGTAFFADVLEGLVVEPTLTPYQQEIANSLRNMHHPDSYSFGYLRSAVQRFLDGGSAERLRSAFIDIEAAREAVKAEK